MLDQVVLDLEAGARLAFALLLSGVIGWEREKHRRPAGLRTHMLVGMSATLVVIIAGSAVTASQGLGDMVRFDPTRVIQAIVTGISFLGAGTIVLTRSHRRVQGLTTAASILATSCIGITVGFGRYLLASISTLLVFGVLAVLRELESRAMTRL